MYRKLVGKLIYLTTTRPDLSFAAQALGQFSHQPRTTNMEALYRVLTYIKLCPGKGLHFQRTIASVYLSTVIVIGHLVPYPKDMF
ncbi:hypothetical protein CTI12_AA007540 [Artemisia annua]|uniref:Uncharacterized protein n=1 Tax=Artemisia annua TaxID=35608 RepID=A0A2U1QN99_ARTAN|nr:hypothetical protein CTI12_AA007540 [Artemisia annua]